MYYVTGADGKLYGPVDVPTLTAWAQENRIKPDTLLKDASTNQQLYLSQVPGFVMMPPQTAQPTPGATPNYSQAPTAYPRGYNAAGGTYSTNTPYQTESQNLWSSWYFLRPLIFAPIIIGLAIFRPGYGLISGLIGVVYACRLLSHPDNKKWIALGVALAAWAIAIGIFVMSLGHQSPGY